MLSDLFKIGKEASPSPAWVPELLPDVVVCGGPAVKEHAVDDGASADNGRSGDLESPVVQALLWGAGQVVPVGSVV